MSKVVQVQREFRKTGLETRLLKVGGMKAVLPCTTRWTSQRSSCASFLKNLPAMKRVAADDDELPSTEQTDCIRPSTGVSQILFNDNFVESVKHMLQLLDPVAELTNDCQRSDFSAADAIEKWLSLLENASEELRGFLENRCDKSNVFNKITITANFLHPVYRGRKLNSVQTRDVQDFLFEKLDAAGLESSRLYNIGDGTFGALARKNISSPNTYWYYAIQQGHKELGELAMKLMKLPSSTAQLERLFSNWAFVHDDIWNRLHPETSKKLVDVYFTLRANDICDLDDIESDENE